MKPGKRIPISATKSIGDAYGYTQVIVTAFDKQTGITSVSTWGRSQEDCVQAAEGGNFVKKALGWPPEQCEAKPARQIRNEKLKKVLSDLVEIYENPSTNDAANLVRFCACAEIAKRLLTN